MTHRKHTVNQQLVCLNQIDQASNHRPAQECVYYFLFSPLVLTGENSFVKLWWVPPAACDSSVENVFLDKRETYGGVCHLLSHTSHGALLHT